MSNLLQTGAEFEKKLKERAESTEKMLNNEFRRLGESVSEAVTSNETKIRDAIALFTASTEESLEKHREGVKEAMMQHRRDVLKLAGNTGMMLLGIVFLLFTASGGTLWYLGGRIQANLEEIRKQEETLQKLNAKTWGVEFVQDGNRKFLVLPYGKSAEVIPFQGKEWVHLTQSDRAGNTFAERLRAAATGLYAAAERMGERLRGIAEDVFAYATGQRDAERAGHAVESAGAALERADRTLEPVIQRELEIREERLIQEREHVLSLERERQPEIQERTLDGPSLGW